MLKQHEVNWVKQLAERGLSRRAIAFQTGYTRDTVRKILAGRRPDPPPLEVIRETDDEPIFTGPIERCPSCGARVYMPCIACHVRAFKQAELRSADLAAAALRQRRPPRNDSQPRRCA